VHYLAVCSMLLTKTASASAASNDQTTSIEGEAP
jgi:hypothetical protein